MIKLIRKNKTKIILINIIAVIVIFGIAYVKETYLREDFDFNTDNLKQIYKQKNINLDPKHKTLTKCDVNMFNCKEFEYDLYKINKNALFKISVNKNSTTELLTKYNVPMPKQAFISHEEYLKTYNRRELIKNKLKHNTISYPVVVKPNKGSFSQNVFTNINTYEELEEKINYIINNEESSVLIEEFIKGEDYRILIYNDKIVDIVLRRKPNVIGNGKNTLNDLIRIKNDDKMKKGKYIMKDFDMKLIKSQGYNMNSIIPKGKLVQVDSLPKLKNGTDMIKVPLQTLHHDNSKLFIKIARIMKAKIIGIDFITTDISKSYKQEGHVNETNLNPFNINEYADPNFNSEFIDTIFN